MRDNSQSTINVIAGPSSPDLAGRISRQIPAAELVPVELRFFCDGESKVRFRKVRGRCVIVQSTFPPVDTHLMHIFMMAKKCFADGATDITAVIPYLAYARQDRVFLDGELPSAELIADLLNASGVTSLVTVDIHSELALQYVSHAQNLSAIPKLAEYAQSNLALRNPVIVSPDSGGLSRAKMFANILGSKVLALDKTRDRESGEIKMDVKSMNEFQGNDAILVDDIISSGASISKAAEILKANGCRDVYAICTHYLAIGSATQKLRDAGITDIISTNSVPNEYAKVDLSTVISDSLQSQK